VITLRPWLDRLLLATLVVTTWHKLHWAPGAGDVTLEDVLAAAFVGLFVADRCIRRDWRLHRVALALLLAMGALIAVYLAGYFALENSQQLSQYAKGMAKFVLHFGFLVAGTQYVIDRGERLLRRTVWAFVLGLAINCAYGVAQLLAQVGAGVNLDKALIGPLTFGQGSLGGINVYGQATAVQSGSYVSLGVYRVNALALDPNHLGIMLCVPILLLIPFALRAGLRSRRGLALTCLLAFFLAVDVLTLSRSGFLGLGCGLVILAWPLRRQLLVPRLVVPALAGLAALVLVLASSPYVRQVVRSRVTVSDNSAKVHFQFFDLVQPVLDAHPVFGLGLNTFSVYYEFLTGKTNWGPHSFYIALLDETGLVGAVVFAAFLVWVGLRLAVILRASRALKRLGDAEADDVRDLGLGLSAGLAATLIANVFYLTMQFYYFYGVVLIIAAASALAVERVRLARRHPALDRPDLVRPAPVP
jgi:O-antigen ligase